MFAHIFFLYHPELNKGGILGYKYWSVFFASMMYPVLFFDFAYLWSRVAKKYITDKKGKIYSNVLVGTFYFFSIFYFIITFFPYNNSYNRIGLNPFWYYIASGISTLVTVFMIAYLPQKIKDITIDKLKFQLYKYQRAIQILIRFITKQRFKAKSLREYEVDYREVLLKLDKVTE